MSKLKIRFTKPPGLINTQTGGKQIVEKFEDWKSIPDPIPATKNVPQWYKQTSSWDGKIGTVPTIKKCPPFLDAMTSGYIINFCGDLRISYNSNKQVSKSDDPAQIFVSAHVKSQYESAPWADKPVLKFSSPWIIETPPGWSCLFTHPFNDVESKFTMLTGIVDTDTYRVPVNFPFLLDIAVGEELHLTKETAMVQVIPFKRQDWEMEVGESNWIEWQTHQNVLGKPGSDAYKNNFHTKKKYT